MNIKIKILHLEDSLLDSELIHSLIKNGGVRHDYFLANNEKDYLKILENENIDIILSDFSLPDYNGNDALKVAKEKYAQIPFIFISGTIGEDAAIQAMLNGATDYVLKNKIERLVPAIKRALHETKLEHERKLAVKAMADSETRYRRLFETAKDGILILDAKTGRIMDVNPYLIEMLCYSKEQFIKKTIWEIGLFKDIIANHDHFLTLQENEYIRYDDLPLELADGRKINVEFVSNIYTVHHHKVIQCNIRDITKRKGIEKLLQQSNELFHTVLNSAPITIFATDSKGVFTLHEGRALQRVGMKSGENVGMSAYELFNSLPVIETTGKVTTGEDVIQRVLGGETVTGITELKDVCFDNLFAPLLDTQGQVMGIVGVATDITDRRQAEENLKRSEEKYRSYIENAPDGVFIIDDNGRYIKINKAAIGILGYTEKEIRKLHIRDLLADESVKDGLNHFKEIMETGKAASDLWHIHKDGSKRCLTIDAVKLSENRILGFCKDITKSKLAEMMLRQSEEKFRLLVENSHDIIFTLDTAGVFLFVSPAWTLLLGHPVSEVIGKNFQPFVHPDDVHKCMLFLQKVVTTGQPQSGIEYRVQHMDRSWHWHTTNAVPIKNEAGNVVSSVGTARDITQEKQFDKRIINAIIDSEEEQRRIFAQELHDGLGPMFPAVKLFLKSMKSTEDKVNTDRLINKVIDIMNESIIIIKELSQKLSPHVLVNHGLNSALNDYFSKIKSKGIHIEYKSNLSERLSSTIETALYRVIMELINNSIKYADAKQIKISICKTENILHVRYSDKGCGFDVTSMLQSNKGNGLFNIINRMNAVDAEYGFISSCGKGFSFYANINTI